MKTNIAKGFLVGVAGFIMIVMTIAYFPVNAQKQQEEETVTFTMTTSEFQNFANQLGRVNSWVDSTNIPSKEAQKIAKSVNLELSKGFQMLMAKQVKAKK